MHNGCTVVILFFVMHHMNVLFKFDLRLGGNVEQT